MLFRSLNVVLAVPAVRAQELSPAVRIAAQCAGESDPRVTHFELRPQFYASCITLGHPERKMTFAQIELDARSARKIALIKGKLPPRGWLAATVCLEHFTAIMARDLLSDPSLTAGMHPSMRQLWTWHALEELEHKAVAFDVYKAIGGKYSTRVKAMLFVSANFAIDTLRNLFALLRAEGKLWSPGLWWRGLGFLFGRSPGVFWRTLPGWIAFFRPGFHPWDDDDRALIARADQGSSLAVPSGPEPD